MRATSPDLKLQSVKLIAWDFDGVLNANIQGGRLLWHRQFEADLKAPIDDFVAYVFSSGRFSQALIGQTDIEDILNSWIVHANLDLTASQLLDYWFLHDHFPDDDMIELVTDISVRQVIATNNEPRRAKYIWKDSGWADRVERMFASGEIGLAKPDRKFFDHISQTVELDPSLMLLIDDTQKNVIAAKNAGWQAVHFTPATRAGLCERLRSLRN